MAPAIKSVLMLSNLHYYNPNDIPKYLVSQWKQAFHLP